MLVGMLLRMALPLMLGLALHFRRAGIDLGRTVLLLPRVLPGRPGHRNFVRRGAPSSGFNHQQAHVAYHGRARRNRTRSAAGRPRPARTQSAGGRAPFGHVKDAEYLDLPDTLGGQVHLPQPFKTDEPLFTVRTGIPQIDGRIEPLDLKFTKFMLMEVVAAVLWSLFFIRLADKLSGGRSPKGALNMPGSDGRVHSRQRRPAGDRRSRRRPLPAVSLDAVLFRRWPATCWDWCPGPDRATGALATTRHAGVGDIRDGRRRGNGQAGPRRLLDGPGAAHGIASGRWSSCSSR